MLLPIASRFIHWFTVGLIVPVLNLLLLSKGLDLAGVGAATALYSAVIVLLELPSGIFADVVGRKRSYLLSLALAGLGYAGVALASGRLFVMLALCFVGAGRAFSSGSLEALFIDRFLAERGEAELHKLASAFSMAEASGLALGALAGGGIPLLWSRLAPGTGRYQGNLLAQLAIVLFHGLLVALAVKDDAGSPRERRNEGRRTSRRPAAFIRESFAFVGANRILRLLLLSALFWGLAFSSIELLWQPRLRDLLGSDQKSWIFGLLSSGYFLAAVLGSALVPSILGRWKPSLPRLLALLRLLCGLFIAVLALQGSALGFGIVYLAMFSFNGMAGPPEATLFNLELPSERRASLLSLASLAMQLGGIGGALGFGLLAAKSSVPTAWVVAGSVFAASSLIYIAVGRALDGRGAARVP